MRKGWHFLFCGKGVEIQMAQSVKIPVELQIQQVGGQLAELKKALKGCTYGDVNDKRYVKELIAS